MYDCMLFGSELDATSRSCVGSFERGERAPESVAEATWEARAKAVASKLARAAALESTLADANEQVSA
jgi:hypothetical protein